MNTYNAADTRQQPNAGNDIYKCRKLIRISSHVHSDDGAHIIELICDDFDFWFFNVENLA